MTTTAHAQSPQDFFNQLFQPGIRFFVEQEWKSVAPDEIACLDQALRQRGSSLRTVIRRGIRPSDSGLSDMRRACADGNGTQADTDASGPSFSCRGVTRPDDVAICADSQLSRLDRTTAEGFSYLREQYGDRRARLIANQWLRERRTCFGDVVCIKRVQSATIADFIARGAPIQQPQVAANENMPPSPPPVTDPQPQPQPQPPAPAAPVQIAPATPTPTPMPVPSPQAGPAVSASPTPTPEVVAPPKDVRVILPGPVVAEPKPAPTSESHSPVIGILLALIAVLAAAVGLLALRLRRQRVAQPAAKAGPAAAKTQKPAAPSTMTKAQASIDFDALTPSGGPLDAEPASPDEPTKPKPAGG